VLRGQLTGRWPEGFASPKRTSAIPLPPWLPGYQASRIAGTCSAAHEMSRGRPLTRTRTTGLPVADTASSKSSWPFDSLSEEREADSALIKSISPRTSTATSLCRAKDTASSIAWRACCGVCSGCSFRSFKRSIPSNGEGITRRRFGPCAKATCAADPTLS